MSLSSVPSAPAERVAHGRRGPHDFELGVTGFWWSELEDPRRLADLSRAFDRALEADDAALFGEFDRWRRGEKLAPPAESELLIRVARQVSTFVAKLFRVEQARARLADATSRDAPIWAFKEFVKKAAKKHPAPPEGEAERLDGEVDRIARECLVTSEADRELMLARAVVHLTEKKDEARLDVFARWAAASLHHKNSRVAGWSVFHFPHALDYANLVQIKRPDEKLPEAFVGAGHLRRRDGFRLTDRRMALRDVLGEADYCLLCHKREKDSCSKGFAQPAPISTGEGEHVQLGHYKKNPLGIPLTGCPLEERISEFHALVREGDALGAVALVCVDNPMLPGTGHRICNDCMKGCIFQKQSPVDIPQIETRALTEVLRMPWGIEIYALLAKWNPLNRRRPHPAPYHGKNVLVVGLGPAGYTLSHHLLNEGFGVVAIDGLKIEPVADGLLARPIEDFREVERELDERVLSGFGGVAEYGITVRWDKNFLTVIQLVLARRRRFQVYGGVRFGGTLTIDDAWGLGMDHIAIAAGAGKPTIIEFKNNLIRGIRKASDFLMALQLGGAFKKNSLSVLQVRLPAVVIGGGLTAIDTATELAAYYPVQVEKTLDRWEEMVRLHGEDAVWRMYDEEEREIVRTFLEHGRAVRVERDRAAEAQEDPDLARLVDGWGGVSIAYRKSLQDSPAYRLNHEEVIKCLEEGVRFVEHVSPVEAVPDKFGAVSAMAFKRSAGGSVTLPAGTVCIAAGTSPNVVYEREYPGTFVIDPKKHSFKSHDLVENRLVPGPGFFTSYQKDGRFITYYGDNHPDYAGSVVRAMASAKDGFPHVEALFARELGELKAEDQPVRDAAWETTVRRLDDALVPTVVRVDRLTPTIVEVILRAPQAARRFQPGQFYRLQNYETRTHAVLGNKLTMEGIALTGAWVDVEKGLLSLIVLEMGGSSRLCALLRPGEPVVCMGPTGAPSEIPRGEHVLLAGGGLGNAVLFSIGKALKQSHNTVVYFAGYRRKADVFKMEDIEAATDQVIWSVDAGEPIVARRPQDRSFVGNIVNAMLSFARGELGEHMEEFAEVDRVIAIGSDRMMAAVAKARHSVLAQHLKKSHVGIASINSPMQCMMKEVCAQCLQRHVDPKTGALSAPVFSCFNQDQLMDEVDWGNLNDRLKQQTALEKLTNLWLDRLLAGQPLPRV